jgi:hypothetical protein
MITESKIMESQIENIRKSQRIIGADYSEYPNPLGELLEYRKEVYKAREKGLKTEIYKPDWTIGKHAGFLRNKTIVDNSDYLIAITTGSKGTASSIQLAEKKGMPIKIIQYE